MPSMEHARHPDLPDETVAPARPTSAVLANLLAADLPATVTPDWIIDGLGQRSYGLVMLLLGLLALMPGLSLVAGLLLVWMSSQMILARPAPTMPRVLRRRAVPTRRFAGLLTRLIPAMRFVERFIHPRWPTPFAATQRGLGILLLLLGISLMSPIPFTQYVPAIVIMAMAIAYLERDGVMLVGSVAGALLSLAITGAELWVAYSGAGAL